MHIREVMTRGAECIGPDASLQEAAEQMKLLDVGALPVFEHDRLIGVLTDRDITVRSVCDGQNPWTDHVRDAMTPEVFYCFEDEDAADAAHLMKEKHIRRLPVLNRSQQLVGIISLSDLAVRTGDAHLAGHALGGI